MPRYTEVNYTIAMEADWNITHCPKGYAFTIKRPDASVVCQLHNGLTPQDKALAQLISAAPDLLNAAELAADAILTENHKKQMDAFVQLAIAISKAKGETVDA
jgi:hypothetical protein